jgi:hypothetical protein
MFIAVSFVEVFFPWKERLYYLRLPQTRYLAESTLHVLRSRQKMVIIPNVK